MNYRDVVGAIKDIAMAMDLVSTWVGDVDKISSYHDLKYGVIAMSPGIITIDGGYMTVGLSLYYITRRFTEQQTNVNIREEDSALYFQSQGIDLLHVLVKKLPKDIGVVLEQYDVFNEQHLDDCCGARVDLELRVGYTYCPDTWLNG